MRPFYIDYGIALFAAVGLEKGANATRHDQARFAMQVKRYNGVLA
jgi:hypothetical protein